MGDRGNIAVQDQGERVYFYSHWEGIQLPEIVRLALAKNTRWDDPPYLARIIFCQLVEGDTSTTGFGISHCIGDSNHPVVVVDCDSGVVYLESDTGACKRLGREFSFGEYATLPTADFSTFEANATA